MGAAQPKLTRYLESTASQRFLSLKWKALLLSSLVLLVIVVSFCLISYISLTNQFAEQRDAEHQRYAQVVQGLIEQSAQHLQQIGAVMPSLAGMNTALLGVPGEGVQTVFANHWPLLQLEMGLEFVRFFSRTGYLLSSVGASARQQPSLDETLRVLEVNRTESPVSHLDCAQICTHHAFVPLLVEGKSAGVVQVAGSLVEPVLGFRLATGNDIGLLVSDPGTPGDRGKWLPGWQVRVAALTNSERNLPILRKLAQLRPHLASLISGIQLHLGQSFYEIRLLPLQGFNIGDKPHLIVFTDITAATDTIRSLIRQNILIGAIALLLSELVLFIILTISLSRLRHTVRSLPLLARSAFGKLRFSIRRSARHVWVKDEIDMLDETAVALSYQLEALENQVREHNATLDRRMDELARERDFVKSLLDIAQIVILTQNSQGKILSFNNYGEGLTHYGEDELRGKSFLALLSPEDITLKLHKSLLEIQTGERDQLRHEAVTVCKQGTSSHIVWLHSRLQGGSRTDPAILSVGLDITERKQAESRLTWLADHDPLTGLFNRRRFQNELEQALKLAERYDRPGALLFFDLDQFKYVNDTSGHQAGDELLKIVSRTLSAISRTSDVIGRLGGDEFGILLPETPLNGAIEVAKKLISELHQAELVMSEHTHKISASIGIALFPQHATNVSELLALADLAMYQAKDSGRGGWHLFAPEDQSRERMQALVFWKDKIVQALTEDRFVLYFQPIMAVRDKSISHFEVLIRMRGEGDTIITPCAFIPAAERTGLIHTIDHLVLRKAIAQAAELSRQGREISFSINLSAHSFDDPELLPVIKDALQLNRANPRNFIFEITETAALADIGAARKLMESIKALGCRFALDDFGVGFSSFFYLKELPVDYVKIDGSFIVHLADNPDDQILVRALSDVARGFGKITVAEFVENAATLALLEEYQVNYAQGFFVGHPVPAEEAFQHADVLEVSLTSDHRERQLRA